MLYEYFEARLLCGFSKHSLLRLECRNRVVFVHVLVNACLYLAVEHVVQQEVEEFDNVQTQWVADLAS